MKDIIKNMISQAETTENFDLIDSIKQLIDELAGTYNAPCNWRTIGEELAREYDPECWAFEHLDLWSYIE